MSVTVGKILLSLRTQSISTAVRSALGVFHPSVNTAVCWSLDVQDEGTVLRKVLAVFSCRLSGFNARYDGIGGMSTVTLCSQNSVNEWNDFSDSSNA